MLTRSGLAILDYIATNGEATIPDLKDETGYSQKQLYKSVNALTKTNELIETRGVNNQRELTPGNSPLITTYQTLLSQTGHINWTNILTPALLRVCWYLDTPRTIVEIADNLELTKNAVYEALDPIKDRAMLAPDGPTYALTDDMQPLHDVADAAVRQAHEHRLTEFDSRTVLLWYNPISCLVQPPNGNTTHELDNTHNWYSTGLEAFQEHNLTFHTPHERLFWYHPERPPASEELVCHALVKDPTDIRRVSYALLLVEHANLDTSTLTELSGRYGLSTQIDAICNVVDDDTWETASVLPSQQEYASLKKQYGVSPNA